MVSGGSVAAAVASAAAGAASDGRQPRSAPGAVSSTRPAVPVPAAPGVEVERLVPQSMQNFASGGFSVPQEGQRAASAAPHDMQNRARSGFSVPQLGQLIPSPTWQ